jgi:hypothetical protein
MFNNRLSSGRTRHEKVPAMKTTSIFAVLGVCAVCQGCGPISYATRTLVVEPVHYCLTADNIVETHRNYRLAEEAWKEIMNAESEHPYSADYAAGFKDGFADYLYAGGTTEPPPLPPRHYWKARYETPEGHQAIEDWFAGFRVGVSVAQQSGIRQWVTIPSSLSSRNAISAGSDTAPPAEMSLPLPRKIAPDKDGVEGGAPHDAIAPSAAKERVFTAPANPLGPLR